MNASRDAERKIGRYEQVLPILALLKSRIEKTQPLVTAQNAQGKAIGYLACNESKLERYVEEGYLPLDKNAAELKVRPFFIGRYNLLFSGRAHVRDGQCSNLQPGVDRQSQRPRALCVAAPRTRTPANCDIG
nr:IS66 family transposase [Pseudomonas viridiflava]